MSTAPNPAFDLGMDGSPVVELPNGSRAHSEHEGGLIVTFPVSAKVIVVSGKRCRLFDPIGDTPIDR